MCTIYCITLKLFYIISRIDQIYFTKYVKKRLKKIFLFQIKGRYLTQDSNEAISKLPKTMRESLKNLDKNDIAGAILVSSVVFITYYIINLISTI